MYIILFMRVFMPLWAARNMLLAMLVLHAFNEGPEQQNKNITLVILIFWQNEQNGKMH